MPPEGGGPGRSGFPPAPPLRNPTLLHSGGTVIPDTREILAQKDFERSRWRLVGETEWRARWGDEVAGLPARRESRFWLAIGLLLPIWGPAARRKPARAAADHRRRRIAHRPRSRRRTGPRRSRELRARRRPRPHRRRGVLDRDRTRRRLARRRVFGAPRVEIDGPADTDLPALKRLGCQVEIIASRARVFAPDPQTLDRVFERWPAATRPGGGQPPAKRGHGSVPAKSVPPAMVASLGGSAPLVSS